MKVYETKGFPNPARVRIALAEKGLFDQAEFIHVDVVGGEHRKPEFLAKNPSGAVPVLETEDGLNLSECPAITEYLDHLTGEPVLTGTSAQERGVISMIQRKVEAGLLNAVGDYFHNATEGLGPDLETNQTPHWGERQKTVALKTMDWMNSVLADSSYLAGDRFTVADITAMAGLAFADFVELEIPAHLTNLITWRERVNARPSAALAA